MRTIFGATGDAMAELLRMQREMDRLSGRVMGSARTRVFPPINIYESDDGHVMRVELPGLDPDSLDLTVTSKELVIKGERRRSEAPEGARFHRRERRFGTFSRAFSLEDPIDPDTVEASYEAGVLELRIPRAPQARPRQIAVQAK